MPDRDLTRLVSASRALVRELLGEPAIVANPRIAGAVDRLVDAVVDVEAMRLERRDAVAAGV